MKLTRRELAAALAVGTAAAQTPEQAAPPDDLVVQRENVKRSSEALRKVSIPETLEPTFTFKA